MPVENAVEKYTLWHCLQNLPLFDGLVQCPRPTETRHDSTYGTVVCQYGRGRGDRDRGRQSDVYLTTCSPQELGQAMLCV